MTNPIRVATAALGEPPMTMTDTEAKALALVNEVAVERGGAPVDFYALQNDIIAIALCRAIERLEATEARHAAELRELKERFSEVLLKVKSEIVPEWNQSAFDEIATPFILPVPDPLEDVLSEAGYAVFPDDLERVHAALAARGYEVRKIGDDQ